jgi:hypothetical protein
MISRLISAHEIKHPSKVIFLIHSIFSCSLILLFILERHMKDLNRMVPLLQSKIVRNHRQGRFQILDSNCIRMYNYCQRHPFQVGSFPKLQIPSKIH